MRHLLLAIALVLAGCASPAPECPSAPVPPKAGEAHARTTVLVLGTIHFAHLEQCDYHLGQLKAVLDAVAPTDVAVEITPEALLRGDLLEGPFEMSYLVELARERGVRAAGIDWLPPDDWWLQKDPTFDEAAHKHEIDEIERRMGKAEWPPSLATANSSAYADRMRLLHEANVRHKSDLGDFDWVRRNLWMTKHLADVLAKPGEHRVLVAVGAEHRYFIEDALRMRGDVEVVSFDAIEKHLTPATNAPVSDATLARWKEGEALLDKRIASLAETHPLRSRLISKRQRLRDAIERRGVCSPRS